MARISVAFDTLKYTKTLEEAGFDRKQAEACIEVMNSIIIDNVATKADIDHLDASNKANTDHIKADITRVETAIVNLEKTMRAGMATKGDLWKVAIGCAILIVTGFGVVSAIVP